VTPVIGTVVSFIDLPFVKNQGLYTLSALDGLVHG